MKHSHTYLRSSLSFRESRLCFENEGAPDIQQQGEQKEKKQEGVQQQLESKVKTGQQEQVKELRAKLDKLRAQQTVTQQTQNKESSLKLEMELVQGLLTADPTLLEQEGGAGIVKQMQEFMRTRNSQPLREILQKSLSPLTLQQTAGQFTSPQFLLDTAENILRSSGATALAEFIRERTGRNVDLSTSVGPLYGMIRGIAARIFTTNRLIGAIPGLADTGRDFHYRMALEAHYRATVNPQLPFMTIFAMNNRQLEGAMGIQNGDAIQKSFANLHAAWMPLALPRATSLTAPLPRRPTFEEAQAAVRNPDGVRKEYLAAINNPNGTPNPTPNAPTGNPTENGQPRTIENVVFTPPNHTLEVTTTTPRTFTVDGTRMQFTRDAAGLHLRAGADTVPLRTFLNANNTPVTDLVLMAPNGNAGDIQVRTNATTPGITLNALRTQAIANENQNKNRIRFVNATSVEFLS